ncbi:MAG: arylsulfotransferase family protein [Anaerolineae bacterium]|nr:arylsulfotransferase family protein [Anaerolineae bacterium]
MKLPNSVYPARHFLSLAVIMLGIALLLLSRGEIAAAQASEAPKPAPGYTLISPLFSTETILLDNEQATVHTWTLPYLSGGAAYLLEDGRLLQTGIIEESGWFPEAIRTGGYGHINLLDWDGKVLWEYTLHTETQFAHHGLELMPNGNIMIIAYERFMAQDAIAAGRDPALFPDGRDEFWSEALLEIDPDTSAIVWEWHLWDHLVQDYDPSAANYGDPAAQPELVDINYVVNFPNYQPDYGIHVEWIHMNAVDYNPELDQLLLGARQFNEFWIIDHSTTTAEAAGHTGGTYGKGGDLLYRCGNPAAYRAGDESTQVFWFPHDPRWIAAGLPGTGNMTIFDNGSYVGRDSTRVLEIAPAVHEDGSYDLAAGQAAAGEIVWEYDLTTDFSFILGSAQRQANGNTLISDGYQMHVFEVMPEGQIVWDWREPSGLYIFRSDRYAPDYPAFAGRTLAG